MLEVGQLNLWDPYLSRILTGYLAPMAMTLTWVCPKPHQNPAIALKDLEKC